MNAKISGICPMPCVCLGDAMRGVGLALKTRDANFKLTD